MTNELLPYRNPRNGLVGFLTAEQAAVFPDLVLDLTYVDGDAVGEPADTLTPSQVADLAAAEAAARAEDEARAAEAAAAAAAAANTSASKGN